MADALARYERRRRTAVRKVQDTADRVAALSDAPDSRRTSALTAVLRVLARSESVAARQDRLVQQEKPARCASRWRCSEGAGPHTRRPAPCVRLTPLPSVRTTVEATVPSPPQPAGG